MRKIAITLAALAILLSIGCKQGDTTAVSSPYTDTSTTTTSLATVPAQTTLYSPSGTDLAFITIIGSGRVGGPYLDSTAQIKVLTDSQSASVITGMVYSDAGDTLIAINYQQYVAIVVFNGFREGISSNLKVLKIRQSANNVYIVAHFDDGGGSYSLPATSSQYQAVEIERNSFIRTGEITFQLLDETGKERAFTTAAITGN
jgi:hypothetical protein